LRNDFIVMICQSFHCCFEFVYGKLGICLSTFHTLLDIWAMFYLVVVYSYGKVNRSPSSPGRIWVWVGRFTASSPYLTKILYNLDLV
jgi:hypothetical protein